MVYRWFSNTALNEATRVFATGMPFMSLGALFSQHAGIAEHKMFPLNGTESNILVSGLTFHTTSPTN